MLINPDLQLKNTVEDAVQRENNIPGERRDIPPECCVLKASLQNSKYLLQTHPETICNRHILEQIKNEGISQHIHL